MTIYIYGLSPYDVDSRYTCGPWEQRYCLRRVDTYLEVVGKRVIPGGKAAGEPPGEEVAGMKTSQNTAHQPGPRVTRQQAAKNKQKMQFSCNIFRYLPFHSKVPDDLKNETADKSLKPDYKVR